MGLRDKYAWAISQAKGKFDGKAEERDGKLYWTGTVKSEQEANEIWMAIKTIPEVRRYAECDRQVSARQCRRLHEDLRRQSRPAE
jgi:hypothetical protein